MGRPIPVFSFVFAAYAARCGSMSAGEIDGAVEARRGEDPFLTAWRSRVARGARIFAKVGVLPGDAAQEPKLATRALGDSYDEVWIGDVVETRLGFIGVAVAEEGSPSRIEAGQRLRFHLINVLDWRYGEALRPDAEPYWNSGKRRPHEMLAQLYETVSK